MAFSIPLALGIFLMGVGVGALLLWLQWNVFKRRLLSELADLLRQSPAEGLDRLHAVEDLRKKGATAGKK